jgi:FKBP-type peptidyl-prolyl cis-trans isomerase
MNREALLGGSLVALVALTVVAYYTYPPLQEWVASLNSAPKEQFLPAIPEERAGLHVVDLVVGEGARFEDPDYWLKITYTGSYEGGEVFDADHATESSAYVVKPKDPNTPIEFIEGLEGMRLGGTRVITVYPNYKSRAESGHPSDAVLVYQVDLLEMLHVHEDDREPPGIPAVQPGL